MEDKLVTVASLEHINQASMLKDCLDSAGIESYILDHGISLEAASQMEGQIELQVNDFDVLKALEVIGHVSAAKPDSSSLGTDSYQIKKILVPVDFSSCSLAAASYAVHVARQKGARVTLIHVYFNPVTDPVSSDHFYAFPANIAESLNEIIENCRQMMKIFMHQLNTYMLQHEISDIQIETELIGGIAEETILDFSVAGGYDLLIIGIQGKRI